MDKSSLIRPKPIKALHIDDSPFAASTQASLSKFPSNHRKTPSLSKSGAQYDVKLTPDEEKQIAGSDIRVVSNIKKSIDTVLKDLDLSKLQTSSPTKTCFSARNSPSKPFWNQPSLFYSPRPHKSPRGFMSPPQSCRNSEPAYLKNNIQTEYMPNRFATEVEENRETYGERESTEREYTEEEEMPKRSHNPFSEQEDDFRFSTGVSPKTFGSFPSKIVLTNSEHEDLPFRNNGYGKSPLMQSRSPMAGFSSPYFQKLQLSSPMHRFKTESDETPSRAIKQGQPNQNQSFGTQEHSDDSKRYSIVICEEVSLEKMPKGFKPQGKVKHYYIQPPPDKSPSAARVPILKDEDSNDEKPEKSSRYLEIPKQFQRKHTLEVDTASEEDAPFSLNSRQETPKLAKSPPQEPLTSPKLTQISEKMKGKKIVEEAAEQEESPTSKKRIDLMPRKMTDDSFTSEEPASRPQSYRAARPLQVEIPTDEDEMPKKMKKGFFIAIPGTKKTGVAAGFASDERKQRPESGRLLKNSQFVASETGRPLRSRLSSRSTLPLEMEERDMNLAHETERLRCQLAYKDAQIQRLVGLFMGLEKKFENLLHVREEGRDALAEAAMSLREGLDQISNASDFDY